MAEQGGGATIVLYTITILHYIMLHYYIILYYIILEVAEQGDGAMQRCRLSTPDYADISLKSSIF